MPKGLEFVLLTLVLSLALTGALLMPQMPTGGNIAWTLVALAMGGSVGLLVRRFSWGALLLAVPLAMLVVITAHQHWGRWPQSLERAAGGLKLVRQQLLMPASRQQQERSQKRSLYLPEDWHIEVYAAGLGQPAMLAWGPRGLFVSRPQQGDVLLLPNKASAEQKPVPQTFGQHLQQPWGLVWQHGWLYVAETGRLLRLQDADGDGYAERQQTLSRHLPAGGEHWQRSLAGDGQGGLYLSVGASCNVCLEQDPRRGAMMHFRPPFQQPEVFAYGLRHCGGMALHPQTGQLWASENGRKMLGDNVPPDEINRVVAQHDYGWPFCYGRQKIDPAYGSEAICANTRAADLLIPAHSAPLGICFGGRLDLPVPWSQVLLAAYHGAPDTGAGRGYMLAAVPFANGQPQGTLKPIIKGWRQQGKAWGRPVCPAVGPDGALYLSDDHAGAIYRIRKEAANGLR